MDRGTSLNCRAPEAGRQPGPPSRLEELGAVRRRARLGDRPRGLQPRRRRLELLPPRPRPEPGLSLERGRPGRLLQPLPEPLPGPRPLERARPDPQGAPLRPVQRGGEPRRGRQGVLLLPRRHADATPSCGCSTSIRRSSTPTPAWSRRTARRSRSEPRVRADRRDRRRLRGRAVTSTSSSSTPRPTRRTSSAGSRPSTAVPSRPRCTSCRTSGSATPGRGATPPIGPSCAASGAAAVRATHRHLGERWWYADVRPHAPELLFTENETNLERLFGVPNAWPVRQGRLPRGVVHGRADRVNPAGAGTKAAAHYHAIVEPGRVARRSAPGSPTAGSTTRSATSTRSFDLRRSPRLMSFTTPCSRRGSTDDERHVQRQA